MCTKKKPRTLKESKTAMRNRTALTNEKSLGRVGVFSSRTKNVVW